MTCDDCKRNEHRLRSIGNFKWVCLVCVSKYQVKKENTFHFAEMVNFKEYRKNGGNVSKARINMMKNRKLCREDMRTVIMLNPITGKQTDRRAYNY